MKIHPHLSEAIAKVIEIIREERKMSKTSLADFADIERCYLLDILKGRKRPTLNAIFSLCEALQVHPVEFIRMVTDEMEKMKK
jgi:transcriptional regulator with XRE-family HTH domain